MTDQLRKWCRSGKRRYESEIEAREQEDAAGQANGFAMTSYLCSCGYWHHRKAKYRGTSIPRKL